MFRRAPERFSALRPPLDSGSVKRSCKAPDAENAPRERDGLFDIVRYDHERSACYSALSHPNSGLPEFGHSKTRPKPDEPTSPAGEGGSRRSQGSFGHPSSARKRGPVIPPGLWVPALAALGRDDDGLVQAKHQPAAVRNDRRPRSIVSGLLFTMDGATPTGFRPCSGRCRLTRAGSPTQPTTSAGGAFRQRPGGKTAGYDSPRRQCAHNPN